MLKFLHCPFKSDMKEFDHVALNNLEQEIHNDEQLIFHKMLKTHQILLIKCCPLRNNDNNDGKIHWATYIFVSKSECLTNKSKPVKTIIKKINLVAHSDTHQLMALYCKDENSIAFFSCSENIREMREQNRWIIKFGDFRWGIKNFSLKKILFDDLNKRLIIIDNCNKLRMYDIHTTTWDAGGQPFDLKDDFDHFLITKDGAFLLAFKPDEEVEDMTDESDESEDEFKEESKEESRRDAVTTKIKDSINKLGATNRVDIAIFFLPEKQHVGTKLLPEYCTADSIKGLRLKYVESDVFLMSVMKNTGHDYEPYKLYYIKLRISNAQSHLASSITEMQACTQYQRSKTKVQFCLFFLLRIIDISYMIP